MVEGPSAPGGQVLPRLSHRPRAGILPHLADPAGRGHRPAREVLAVGRALRGPTSRRSGFDEGRLRWLSFPHVSGAEIAAALGRRRGTRDSDATCGASAAKTCTTSPRSTTASRPCSALDEPQAVKAFLLSVHANRTLLADGAGCSHARLVPRNEEGLPEPLRGGEEKAEGSRRPAPAAIRGGMGRARARGFSRCCRARRTCWCARRTSGTCRAACPGCSTGLGILGLRIVRWAREYEKTPPGSRLRSSRRRATRCSRSARRRSTTPRPSADGGRKTPPSASCSSARWGRRAPARRA